MRPADASALTARRSIVLARRLVPGREPDEAGKANEVEQNFQPGWHERIPILTIGAGREVIADAPAVTPHSLVSFRVARAFLSGDSGKVPALS